MLEAQNNADFSSQSSPQLLKRVSENFTYLQGRVMSLAQEFFSFYIQGEIPALYLSARAISQAADCAISFKEWYQAPINATSSPLLDQAFIRELRNLFNSRSSEILPALGINISVEGRFKERLIDHILEQVVPFLEQLPEGARHQLTEERVVAIRDGQNIQVALRDYVKGLGEEYADRILPQIIATVISTLPSELKRVAFDSGINVYPLQNVQVHLERNGDNYDLEIHCSDPLTRRSAIFTEDREFVDVYRFNNLNKEFFNEELFSFLTLMQQGDRERAVGCKSSDVIAFLKNHFKREPLIERHVSTTAFSLYSETPLSNLLLSELSRGVFEGNVEKAELFLFELEFEAFLAEFRGLDLDKEWLEVLQSKVRGFSEQLVQLKKSATLFSGIDKKKCTEFEATLQEMRSRINEAHARRLRLENQASERFHAHLLPPYISQFFGMIFRIFGDDQQVVDALSKSFQAVIGTSGERLVSALREDYISQNNSVDDDLVNATMTDKAIALSLGFFTHTVVSYCLTPAIQLLQMAGSKTIARSLINFFLYKTLPVSLITSTIFTQVPSKYIKIYNHLWRNLGLLVLPYLVRIAVQTSLLIEKIGIYSLIEKIESLSFLTSCAITQSKINRAKMAVENLEKLLFRSNNLSFNFDENESFVPEIEERSEMIESGFALLAEARFDLEDRLQVTEDEELAQSEQQAYFEEHSLLHREGEPRSFEKPLEYYFTKENAEDFISARKALLESSSLAGTLEQREKVTELLDSFHGALTTKLTADLMQSIQRGEQDTHTIILDHRTGFINHKEIKELFSKFFPSYDFSFLDSLIPDPPAPREAAAHPRPGRINSEDNFVDAVEHWDFPIDPPSIEDLPVEEIEEPRPIEELVSAERLAIFQRISIQGKTLAVWYSELVQMDSSARRSKILELIEEDSLTYNSAEELVEVFNSRIRVKNELIHLLFTLSYVVSKEAHIKNAISLVNLQVQRFYGSISFFAPDGSLDILWQEIMQDEPLRETAIEGLFTHFWNSFIKEKKVDPYLGFMTGSMIYLLSKDSPDFAMGEYAFPKEQFDRFSYTCRSLPLAPFQREQVKRASLYLNQLEDREPLWDPREKIYLTFSESYFSTRLVQSNPLYKTLNRILENDEGLSEALEVVFPNDRDKQIVILLANDCETVINWLSELQEVEPSNKIGEALALLHARGALLPPSFERLFLIGLSTVNFTKNFSDSVNIKSLSRNARITSGPLNPNAGSPLVQHRSASLSKFSVGIDGVDLFFLQSDRQKSDWERTLFTQDEAAEQSSLTSMSMVNSENEFRRLIGLLRQSEDTDPRDYRVKLDTSFFTSFIKRVLFPENTRIHSMEPRAFSTVRLAALFSPTKEGNDPLASINYEEFEESFSVLHRAILKLREDRIKGDFNFMEGVILFSQMLKGYAIQKFPQRYQEIREAGISSSELDEFLIYWEPRAEINRRLKSLFEAYLFFTMDPRALPIEIRNEAISKMCAFIYLGTSDFRLQSTENHTFVTGPLAAIWQRVIFEELKNSNELAKETALWIASTYRSYNLELLASQDWSFHEDLTLRSSGGEVIDLLDQKANSHLSGERYIHNQRESTIEVLFSSLMGFDPKGTFTPVSEDQFSLISQEYIGVPREDFYYSKDLDIFIGVDLLTEFKIIGNKFYFSALRLPDRNYIIFLNGEEDSNTSYALYNIGNLSERLDHITIEKPDPFIYDRFQSAEVLGGELYEKVDFPEFPHAASLKAFADSVIFYKRFGSASRYPEKMVLAKKEQSYSFTIRNNRAYYDDNPSLFLSRNQEAYAGKLGDYLVLEDEKQNRFLLIDFFSFTINSASTYLSSVLPGMDSGITPRFLSRAFSTAVDNKDKGERAKVIPLTKGMIDPDKLDFKSALHLAIHSYFASNHRDFVFYLQRMKQIQQVQPLRQEDLDALSQFILFNFSYLLDHQTIYFLSLISIYLQNIQQFRDPNDFHENVHKHQTAIISLIALSRYNSFVLSPNKDERLFSEFDELMLFEGAIASFLYYNDDKEAFDSLSSAQKKLAVTAAEYLMSASASQRLDELIVKHDSHFSLGKLLLTLKRRVLSGQKISKEVSGLSSFASNQVSKVVPLCSEIPSRSFSSLAYRGIYKDLFSRLINSQLSLEKLDLLKVGSSRERYERLDMQIMVSKEYLSEAYIRKNILTLIPLVLFPSKVDFTSEDWIDGDLFQQKREELLNALDSYAHYPVARQTLLIHLLRKLHSKSVQALPDENFTKYRQFVSNFLGREQRVARQQSNVLSPQHCVLLEYPQALINEMQAVKKPHTVIRVIQTLRSATDEAGLCVRSAIASRNVTMPLFRGAMLAANYSLFTTFESFRAGYGALRGLNSVTQELRAADRAREEFNQRALQLNHDNFDKDFLELLDVQDAICKETISNIVEKCFDNSSSQADPLEFMPISTLNASLSNEISMANESITRQIVDMEQEAAHRHYTIKDADSYQTFRDSIISLREKAEEQLREISNSLLFLTNRNRVGGPTLDNLFEAFFDEDREKLASYMRVSADSEFVSHLIKKLYLYFLLKGYHTRLTRAEELIIRENAPSSAAELLMASRNYTFSGDIDDVTNKDRIVRAFMLFEAEMGLLLRKKQVTQSIKMLQKATETNRVCGQYIMGMGKTFFYATWNLFTKWQKGWIPILVVPDSLIESTKGFFNNQYGSLFGKKLHYIPVHRGTMQPLRLKQILHRMRSSRETGDALLFSKDGLASFMAMLNALLYEKLSDKATPIIEEQISLLREILSLLSDWGQLTGDEAHKLFDRKLELNFPVGKKAELSNHSYIAMEQLLLGYLQKVGAGAKDVRELNPALFTMDESKYEAEVKKELARYAASLTYLHIADENKEELISYFMGETEAIPLFVVSHPQSEGIYLLRGLIQKLLPHAFSSRAFVDYGPSANVKTAIPYSGSNTPEEGSFFKSPYVTALLSYFKYFYQGLSIDELAELKQYLKDKIRQEKEEFDVTEAESEIVRRLNEYFGREEVAFDKFTNDELRFNIHTVTYYVSQIVSKDINYYPFNATCNAQNFGSLVRKFDVVTGTPDNFTTYPIGTELVDDHETMGRTLLLLRSKLESGSSMIFPLDTEEEPVHESLLSATLSNPQVRAIIDDGALFQQDAKLTNLEAAKAILEAAIRLGRDIDSVVFYDKDMQLKVLQKSGKVLLFEEDSTPAERRITLYDQMHTVGSDIRQSRDTIGALTVSSQSTWSSFAQALWRLRGFSDAQNCTIILNQPVQKEMQEMGLPFDLDGLTTYLFANSKKELLEDNFHADMQKMDNELWSAIMQTIYRAETNKEALAHFGKFHRILLSPFNADASRLFGQIETEENPRSLIDSRREKLLRDLPRLNELSNGKRHSMSRALVSVGRAEYPERILHMDNLMARVRINITSTETEETNVTEVQNTKKTIERAPAASIGALPTSKWAIGDLALANGAWMNRIDPSSNFVSSMNNFQLQRGVPSYPLNKLFEVSGVDEVVGVSGDVPSNMYATGNLIPRFSKLSLISGSENGLSIPFNTYGLSHWKKPAFNLVIHFTNRGFYTVAIDQFDFREFSRKAKEDALSDDLVIYDFDTDGFILGDVDSARTKALRENEEFMSHVAIWKIMNCTKKVSRWQERALRQFSQSLEDPKAWLQACTEICNNRQLTKGSTVAERSLSISARALVMNSQIF